MLCGVRISYPTERGTRQTWFPSLETIFDDTVSRPFVRSAVGESAECANVLPPPLYSGLEPHPLISSHFFVLRLPAFC